MLWRRRNERRAGPRRDTEELEERRKLLRSRQNQALAGLAGGPFAVPPLDERGYKE
jgi:hypothetical protein